MSDISRDRVLWSKMGLSLKSNNQTMLNLSNSLDLIYVAKPLTRETWLNLCTFLNVRKVSDFSKRDSERPPRVVVEEGEGAYCAFGSTFFFFFFQASSKRCDTLWDRFVREIFQFVRKRFCDFFLNTLMFEVWFFSIVSVTQASISSILNAQIFRTNFLTKPKRN